MMYRPYIPKPKWYRALYNLRNTNSKISKHEMGSTFVTIYEKLLNEKSSKPLNTRIKPLNGIYDA